MKDPRSAIVRRAHIGTAAALIIAAAVALLIAVAVTGAALPSRMATHFGIDGVPDATMATPAALVSLGLMCVGVPGLLLWILGAGQWWRGSGARFMTAFVAGVTVGLTTLVVLLVFSHGGIADAQNVRFGAGMFAASLAAGVVAGMGVAAVLPKSLPQPGPTLVDPITVTPSDRVTWFGKARVKQSVLVAMVVLVVFLSVVTLLSGIWWMWLAVALVCVALLSIATFHVRIDGQGLAWRSAIGLPRGMVKLADVTQASLREIRPSDFGGYGIRIAPGRTGLVTRAGEALSVVHGDRELVITVDDASTAARVLEGLRIATR